MNIDISTIIGLVLAWGALLAGILMEGGSIRQFIQPSAFIIIIGGTIGATVLSFTSAHLIDTFKILKHIIFDKRKAPAEVVNTLVRFAEKVRKEGLLSIENEISQIEDGFFQNALRLMVDGTSSEKMREVLETEIDFLEKRHHVGESIFMTLGGFAPTLGIIGTVMGLVFALSGGAEDPGETVKAIAVAFLATFYGISFANLVFLPIANKLKLKNEDEILTREIIVEGVLSIQSGEHPIMVGEKLSVFLSPAERKQIQRGHSMSDSSKETLNV